MSLVSEYTFIKILNVANIQQKEISMELSKLGSLKKNFVDDIIAVYHSQKMSIVKNNIAVQNIIEYQWWIHYSKGVREHNIQQPLKWSYDPTQ